MTERILGTVVRKCSGPESHDQRLSSDGEFAEIVGAYSEPTYILKDVFGDEITWVQSLTRPASPAETIAYWEDRAKRAEERLASRRTVVVE